MADGEDERELELPEQEFKYLAGTTDRPWSHFTGRWKAIRPLLAEMLKKCGNDRPLRVVDLGSCTGFFSLQAAHSHPEADIVAIEGSVGVGNGTVGTLGSSRQILATEAVQTHLRWIQRLALPNCFVAPEVWDYVRVCELASQGRPICDAMLLLSVVHHVDGVSTQQYTSAGLSRLDGLMDLLSKLLLLSPRHFVELPNRPWMACAYDAYGSARAILEAAAKLSSLQWQFRGPIYSVDWFGLRELWVMEATTPMLPVDVQSCPFPLLYRGEEQDFKQDFTGAGDDDMVGDLGALSTYDSMSDGLGGMLEDTGFVGDVAALAAAGSTVDPGLMTLIEPYEKADDRIGAALHAAPTQLLVAHLALREAMTEACNLLAEVKNSGLLDAPAPALPARGRGAPVLPMEGPAFRGPPPRGGPPPVYAAGPLQAPAPMPPPPAGPGLAFLQQA